MDVELHGFSLWNISGRTTGAQPDGLDTGDFILGEGRFRLDLSAWAEEVEAAARVKADLLHDAVVGESALELREAYIDYTNGDYDFRLGRQIATWGVGDLLFINDVFPKDWESFFGGRPLEYLKLPVDAARISYFAAGINADLLIAPFFEPDNLPTGRRFIFDEPFREVPSRVDQRPRSTYENTELALRLHGKLSGFDVAAYAYRGFWRSPAMRPDNFETPAEVTAYYPRLSVYGLSAQGNALDGILSFETGYYDSREDRDGSDPVVQNSQMRFLLGYQRQIAPELNLGLQYYGELMQDHSSYLASLPQGFPQQSRYRDTIALRLERYSSHQALKQTLFAFFSPADHDYLAQPQVSYKFADNLTGTLGASIFGGKRPTFFGQFGRNDNVFLSVRFDF